MQYLHDYVQNLVNMQFYRLIIAEYYATPFKK